MNLALDTNAYTDLARGVSQITLLVGIADTVHLPFIVLAELRAGFALGTKSQENERILSVFLAKPQVLVLYADNQTVFHYAKLFKELRLAGRMIPANDMWIASLCIQHRLTLCSRDSHFDPIVQIPRA